METIEIKLKEHIAFWEKQREAAKAHLSKTEKILSDLRATCTHTYSDGTSAIDDDAFASPYAIRKCKICGKTFE